MLSGVLSICPFWHSDFKNPSALPGCSACLKISASPTHFVYDIIIFGGIFSFYCHKNAMLWNFGILFAVLGF